jgi:tetratricopeptide (TPR) repeat protein
MKTFLILLGTVLLSACAGAPTSVTPPAARLFNDRLFAAPAQKIQPDKILAISDEMRGFLRLDVAELARRDGQKRGLAEALYKNGDLRIEYEGSKTRTAEEAFAARSGNCLSLVIMVAALAREMGIPFQYQSVFIEENWSRQHGMYILNGHVNLTLGSCSAIARFGTAAGTSFEADPPITIDFLPLDGQGRQRIKRISENTVLAMYMNNRAAESMAADKLNDAYWWASAAIHQDPSFYAAYNTLGVVYNRHGDLAEAENVLQFILANQSENTQAMANLVQVYRQHGRIAEAEAMSARLLQLQPFPPFYYFNQGLEAMHAGETKKAKDLFQRELNRAGDYHEFHFWLAVADYKLGDYKAADEHMSAALEYSTTRNERDLYSAKLAHIKKLQHQ